MDKDKIDEKHLKYRSQYIPNTVYWGIGIENEVYLEFDGKYTISKEELLLKKNRKRERYSVDYYSNYKKSDLINAIRHLPSSELTVPVLFNANSFTRTDAHNQPKTLYTQHCEPNPEFSGETLIRTLQKHNPYFKRTRNLGWLFDGDTIEFNTINFFNNTLPNIIGELNNHKREFIVNLNQTLNHAMTNDYGGLKIMEANHPFATYATNLKKISMFNNGTLHYNLTLPTQLDSHGKIANMEQFIKDHSKAIKIIQWMEPLILSKYGSPDPFSDLGYPEHDKFSGASQRCAISRYIGIGTFNSDVMPAGKILTQPINQIMPSHGFWWFNEYYRNNAYNKLDEIGVDINFNKHYNHGIELRFFDHIPDDSKLFQSFELIIYLMDHILDTNVELLNPIFNRTWNQLVLGVMRYGRDYQLTVEEKCLYDKLFGITIKTRTAGDIYQEIYQALMVRYNLIKPSTITIAGDKPLYQITPVGQFSKCCLNPRVECLEVTSKTQHVVTLRNLPPKKKNCCILM